MTKAAFLDYFRRLPQFGFLINESGNCWAQFTRGDMTILIDRRKRLPVVNGKQTNIKFWELN